MKCGEDVVEVLYTSDLAVAIQIMHFYIFSAAWDVYTLVCCCPLCTYSKIIIIKK